MKKLVGILGGAFDPIHHGHLRMAIECREQLQLASIRFIPCGKPVHRGPLQANDAQRLKMLALATQDDSTLIVDDREIRKTSPSYTIDTVDSLQQDFPDIKFCLLLGTDAFQQLTAWKSYTTLMQKIHIIVAHRPGFICPTTLPITKNLSALENETPAIISLTIPELMISSSLIRARLQHHHSVRYLLPEAVLHYMQQEKLYDL